MLRSSNRLSTGHMMTHPENIMFSDTQTVENANLYKSRLMKRALYV